MTKIAILIPGYNVAKTIESVLQRFSGETLKSVDEIVFIDNLSSDETVSVVREMQADPGSELGSRLTLIRNERNHGLGGSLKIGLNYMLDHEFSHFMIIHSDKQGDSEEIARNFLERLKRNPDVDFVMASRFIKGAQIEGYSWIRTLGNYFFNFLTFILTGNRMSDSGCGIVLMRTEILKRVPFASLTGSLFFNPQLNILLFDLGDIRIHQIPLAWKDAETGSSLKAVRYVATLSKTLLRYRWQKLRGLEGFPLDPETLPLDQLGHFVDRPSS